MLKCPYYGLWKVHFGFGSPQQQVDMHARLKKTFIVNMHLFLPFWLNDSQTIRSTIEFYRPSFASR